MRMIDRRRRRRLPCDQVAALLQPYLDDALDDLARRRVARHLDDCRRCGLETETYRAIRVALESRIPVRPDQITALQAFARNLSNPDRPHRDEMTEPS